MKQGPVKERASLNREWKDAKVGRLGDNVV